MSASRPPLSENELRRELASAAELLDPQPPTRDELQALARRRHGLLRTVSPPLLVAAAVAAVAAVSVAVATQHSSQPRPPATTGPDPVPTVSSTPPAPRPSTSHPVVPPPRPSSKESKPSTSASDSGSSSHSAPPPAGFVQGPYGFLIPQGWHVHPLVSGGGGTTFWGSVTREPNPDTASAAPFTADYVSGWLSAGRGVGLPYTSGHQPDLSIAAAGTFCAAVQWQPISSNEISFTCPPVSGQVPRGVLIVEPYPNGTKQVVVTLPAGQQSTATQILDSFH